ncbi:MAG: exosortase-associated EpsI family protein [Planctomycetes bacterium]|nr:exosortase-associated EpsI family protein [Planctomycetota bacterium]
MTSPVRSIVSRGRAPRRRCRAAAEAAGLFITVAVVAVLLIAGFGFRVRGLLKGESSRPSTPLRKAFTEFPTDFLDYQWRHGRLDAAVEKVTGAEAYLKMTGFRKSDGSYLELYTSYVGKGATAVEHEPQVCYGAQGWQMPHGFIQAKIDGLKVRLSDGSFGPLPVNVYLFEKDVDHQMVVNFYCINGKYTDSRVTARTEADRPGGFYAQTRVTLPLSGVEWAETGPKTYADSRRFKQAVEVLRYVVPIIEAEYLPVAPGSSAQ